MSVFKCITFTQCCVMLKLEKASVILICTGNSVWNEMDYWFSGTHSVSKRMYSYLFKQKVTAMRCVPCAMAKTVVLYRICTSPFAENVNVISCPHFLFLSVSALCNQLSSSLWAPQLPCLYACLHKIWEIRLGSNMSINEGVLNAGISSEVAFIIMHLGVDQN